MEPKFWYQKWKDNVIGFHLNEPNPLLLTHFEALSLKEDSRIFLPLCGKTLDIAWLLSKGHRVVGAELSEIAIDQLFEALGLTPDIKDLGDLTHYSAENIDIFVGDIFHLSSKDLGLFDAIYDRAAFVALPRETRERYAAHLIKVTSGAPQLLISFEYNQALMAGPPFSISNKEIDQHFQAAYDLSLIASEAVVGGLKGKCEAVENVWLLKRPAITRVFHEQTIKRPQQGKWKVMLSVLILLVVGSWLVYQYGFDAKVATSGAVLVGIYTGLITWLLGVITLVPIIGPILVKVLTLSFIWLLNAVGYVVAYIAIKRGYSKDVLTYRGLTIALIVGVIIGYIIAQYI